MAKRDGSDLDIIFVISSLGTGGTEGQLALLATAMAKSGRRVAVYTLGDGRVRPALEKNGIEVIVGPAWRGAKNFIGVPFMALDLFFLMLRRRPEIAHYFLPAAYLVGAPLALLARVPVRIMSRRSLNAYQGNGFIRAVERCWHRAMHAVLGNSRSVICELVAEGVAADRLGLIYNGIDTARFSAAGAREPSRAKLGLAPAALTMCIVANLIPYKAHDDLIEALALAAPSLPDGWRLLVAGRDDGIGEALRAQARRLSLHDNIVFLGSRDDIENILNASDIGILCSRTEGFSNSILEGMAAGLPMIVTGVGGNAEAVIDGATGLVVPANDPRRLSMAIVKLAGDPALRAALGKSGRERVTQQFGLDRFVESHQRLYQALVAGKRPSDVANISIEPAASAS